eukprot:COSAG03_NODE_3936_length_1753_cov_2.792019_3_plen_94_part_01
MYCPDQVITLPFKRQRFETLHRAALRWPPERFEFIGIDSEHGETSQHNDAEQVCVCACARVCDVMSLTARLLSLPHPLVGSRGCSRAEELDRAV